ncbi:hypothetical protein BASA81_007879 [Batrachochytrium salamandrivorans]|nr:hypothetical protein BASA81_007879 [Batrachochytrium salamandrivorans]
MVLGVHVQRGQFGAVVDEERDDGVYVLLVEVVPTQRTNLVLVRVNHEFDPFIWFQIRGGGLELGQNSSSRSLILTPRTRSLSNASSAGVDLHCVFAPLSSPPPPRGALSVSLATLSSSSCLVLTVHNRCNLWRPQDFGSLRPLSLGRHGDLRLACLQQHKQRNAVAESVLHFPSRFSVLICVKSLGCLNADTKWPSILLTALPLYHKLNSFILLLGDCNARAISIVQCVISLSGLRARARPLNLNQTIEIVNRYQTFPQHKEGIRETIKYIRDLDDARQPPRGQLRAQRYYEARPREIDDWIMDLSTHPHDRDPDPDPDPELFLRTFKPEEKDKPRLWICARGEKDLSLLKQQEKETLTQYMLRGSLLTLNELKALGGQLDDNQGHVLPESRTAVRGLPRATKSLFDLRPVTTAASPTWDNNSANPPASSAHQGKQQEPLLCSHCEYNKIGKPE